MKTVYYAHPIALYGTDIESTDHCDLLAMGFKVINPSAPQYRAYTMDGFVKLACSADIVAFRAFDDGKIGSGMGLEIDAARAKGILIIEMPSTRLKDRYLTRNETRARMGLPKLRHPDTAPLRTMTDDEPKRKSFTDIWLEDMENGDYADQDWGAM